MYSAHARWLRPLFINAAVAVVFVAAFEWRSIVPLVHRHVRLFLASVVTTGASPSVKLLVGCSQWLYVAIPNTGLGNRLQWLGTAMLLSAHSSRCLGVVTPE